MDSFNKTVSEKKRLDAIDKMKALKSELDVSKARRIEINTELILLESEIKYLRNEILAIYNENFKHIDMD